MIAEKIMAVERIIVYPDTQPGESGLMSQAIAALEKLNRIGSPIPAQMDVVLKALIAYAAEIEERNDKCHS